LKDLRVLRLDIDSATANGALWQVVSQLKRLQRLTVYQLNPGFPGRIASVSLPASLQQLTQLEQLELTLGQSDWKQTFTTLAGMPGLRKLIFSGNGNQNMIPPELGKVRQLTSLTIRNGKSQEYIPASLGALTKLRELNLNYLQLNPNTDWTFLSNLTELETLRLAGNNLRKLPDLRKLKKIQSVDLHENNQLSIVDDALSGLEGLVRLNLSNCQLRQFPPGIARLVNLKELTLNNNPLGELPAELASLKQLEVLQASGCRLQKLAESLGDLTLLHFLNLAGNQLDTLSFDIGKLNRLANLSIYNNQLRFLPASIGRLTALNQLALSNNKLVQLPETIGDLTNLTNLSLVMNQLTGLPAGIGKLMKLNYLDVSSNQLQQLPAEIGKLRRLRHLTLASNKLTQLPETVGALDSLQWVDLSRNQLTVVPDALFRISRLQNLNLSDNKLTAIPVALGKLTNLLYLVLSNNRLTSLPSELGKAAKLQSLQFSDNPLEYLPESIGQCREINTIYGRNTKLKALPEGFSRLTKLQTIDLTGNELTILPAALGNLSQLRSLILGRTRLLALPESIGRLTNLTTLQIGEMGDAATNDYTGLHQLPDSIIYCQGITDLRLANQVNLDGDDTFAKVSQLRKLMHLTLFHCNIGRIPEIDWKTFPVYQLSLMNNRLSEVPVSILESPKLERVDLYENLLPKSLNVNFYNKEALQLALSEAGLLALDKIAKPNRGVANAYVQKAFQKARERNWTDAFADFDKAIDFASDTMRIVLYAQRADMHVFRKEYAEAIADYDRSLNLANPFSKSSASKPPAQRMQFDQPAVLVLRGRANAKAKLGQLEEAISDIDLAIQKLNTMNNDPQLKSSLFTEQGRYLTMKNKVNDANVSYRKAIDEYEKVTNANPGVKLTVVELYIIISQPDQARKALQQIDKRELEGGYAILGKYLENSVQVLKGEKPDAAVLADLASYLSSHSERIMGWSFELYENWLGRSDLPTEKRTVLQQLTQLTKERVPKMD
jgi:Leucine-rich repeat (LRR) protein